MALGSFQLFLGQVQNAPEEVKLRVLQVIFDLLIMYDEEFFSRSDDIVSQRHFLTPPDTECLVSRSGPEDYWVLGADPRVR